MQLLNRHITATVTFQHVVVLSLMFFLVVLGSTVFATIDRTTLKPSSAFPAPLLLASKITNIPIKLGLLHLVLYSLEFYRARGVLFERHVGQRLTTLWFQVLQHPRNGQHLHMQIETALQLTDAICLGRTVFPTQAEQILLQVLRFVMIVTCMITSSAYHTAEEQAIGFFLTLVKLTWDYSTIGSRGNSLIGTAINGPIQILAGFVFVGLAFAFHKYAAFHPTVMATVFFAGAGIAHLVLSSRNPTSKKNNDGDRC